MKEGEILHLFQGFGVELEYMIVERDGLRVLPVADRVLRDGAGEVLNEIEVGPLRWSNELVLHVIELKTNGPAASLAGLGEIFAEHARRINSLLEPHGGRLMPSAMHPWMDPFQEMRLWPHENGPIYEAYNRIFGCRGHGWANLQSAHLNLPFADDREFAVLHAAVRLVLPILPALAASSPVMDGRPTGLIDNRLEVYRLNQALIPSVTGRVIPEPVFNQADYQRVILETMYRDIASHDPQGVLQDEWLNSRGAIARFERNTIEIRVLDVQECPQLDLAIITLIIEVLKALAAERWCSLADQQGWPVEALEPILLGAIRDGEGAIIEDGRYLACFGLERERCRAGELWRHLAETLLGGEQTREELAALSVIFEHGTLSRRILSALGPEPKAQRINDIYRRLCDNLANGRPFVP
ncbi:glutamate--cysteine ligase [Desulfuromonas versatilis]|uniref:Glutamate--cysteine ligase n=1 Tax=Desulfuromonas versatilis TaxID=2802975 RepID=A0ABM8I2A7_9BACT|nr:glutamate-cysteine ligase family protein [Desulfuromonas versatilis]BCR06945.1 glutamate--cysteine ligase [Desulfuromonas versatilis]